MQNSRQSERYALYEKYVNPWTVKAARNLGLQLDFARGQGAYLYDRQGNRYLDCDAGNGVFAIGRNHPQARERLCELMESEPPNMVSRDIPLPAGLLGEALARISPGDLNRAIFTLSGSESADAALKFARRLTGRPRLLYVEGDFHGVTYGALSVTDLSFAREGFGPTLPGCERVPRNDLGALRVELERGDVAALIVEPIQGYDVRPLESDYLRGAQRLCREAGAAFIVDEVFVGFGRTGRMFCCEHWGLEPDVMLLSKALSGGFVPVGAVMVREELFEQVFHSNGVFVHGSTFEHNDFGMAAGLATIEVLEREDLAGRAARLGEALLSGLKELQDRFDLIEEVRGKGLLIGIQFREPRSARLRWSGGLLARKGLLGHLLMIQLLAKYRVLATVVGKTNVLRLTPPLVLRDEDAENILKALAGALEDLYRFPDGISTTLLRHAIRVWRGR